MWRREGNVDVDRFDLLRLLTKEKIILSLSSEGLLEGVSEGY